ncbi:MAG: PL29 family lyase N-terminal domain-containing protein [Bacteroidales bacterium]|nr:PL29 family lyase N-terminal domain-containing protein [Bacteroidales bacterium]
MFRKFINTIAAFAAVLATAGCYNDSAISSRIDAMEARVATLENLNSDIAAVKAIVEGITKNVFIERITTTEKGYAILLSDGNDIVISNGSKGDRGEKGDKGETGAGGLTGGDAQAPTISVKLDGGVYYWTVDGEFLHDADGNKVRVSAEAPKIKLENDGWFVSYDGGATWTFLSGISSTATGFFSDVKVDEASVTFTLLDGTTFTIPIAAAFAFNICEDVPCIPGTETAVPYLATGASKVTVHCLPDGGYRARAEATTPTSGNIVITAPSDGADGQVLVLADNGVKTLLKCIAVSEGVMNVTEAFKFTSEAGRYSIEVETNMNYTAVSDVDWISIVESGTKAQIRKETLTIELKENPEGLPQRTGTIKLVAESGAVIRIITIVQQGDGTLSITKVYYPTLKYQSIDPSEDLEDYASSEVISTEPWIVVNPTTKVLSIAKNEGIVRSGIVKYGKKGIQIIQAPGTSFLDLSFEGANGDLATKNKDVVNVGSASDLTTYFWAYFMNYNQYSSPVTIEYDSTLGHKVAKFHNKACPCSYGGYLWRNSNGNTVKAMYDGFTVELFLSMSDMWAGSEGGEANAFTYKGSPDKDGVKCLQMGVTGNAEKKPVFSALLNGQRLKTSVVAETDKYFHFVLVYDKQSSKEMIYVNGKLEAERIETRNIEDVIIVGSNTEAKFSAFDGSAVCNPWCLGAYMNVSGQTPSLAWNGKIAVCRVYAKTLNASEINQSYVALNSPLER